MNEKLIIYLLKERGETIPLPTNETDRFRLYRGLVNVRPAMSISDEYLTAEDEYLQVLTSEKGVTDIADLSPIENNIYLWKGDITTLKCGAIVNAANSGMTGCYSPCHNCIDNCIHTFAGVRLRLECDEIMRKQGFEEPTGQAKITSAYNLPCDHVIHTVGPIVQGRLTQKHCDLLASCYNSCLELAVQERYQVCRFLLYLNGSFRLSEKRGGGNCCENYS